jgi:ribose transport system permease protein
VSAPAAVETASGPETATAPRRIRLTTGTAQRLGLLVVTAGLVVAFGSARAAFYDEQLNIFPLLRGIAVFTVVGLSQMAVLSIGHMNLAVGRMAAFSAMFMGFTMMAATVSSTMATG